MRSLVVCHRALSALSIGMLAISMAASTQAAGILCGTVRDRSTSAPVPRAGVFLRTTAGVYTGLYAATNTSGFFCIGDVPAGTYDVEVRVDDYRVGYERNVVVVDAPVDVELEAAIPVARLDIAPIPARTHVAFDLFTNRNVPVRLEVFDAAGRSLRAWGANAVTGQRTFTWDFRDRHGRIVPAGQYFVRLEAGSRVVVRRLTRIQ